MSCERVDAPPAAYLSIYLFGQLILCGLLVCTLSMHATCSAARARCRRASRGVRPRADGPVLGAGPALAAL